MTEFFAKYFPNVVQLGWSGDSGWGTSIGQTLYMTFCLWWNPRCVVRRDSGSCKTRRHYGE